MSVERNNLIWGALGRSHVFVAYVDAKSATGLKNPDAFFPYSVEFIEVVREFVPKTNLVRVAVVLDCPVWRRSHYEVNGFVSDGAHVS